MPILRVSVVANLSGEPLLDCRFPPLSGRCSWETFVHALHIATGKRLNVPLLCLKLIWPVPSTELPIGTDHIVIKWSTAPCGDPCEDADLPTAERSREENCGQCGPCFLCDGCRIKKPERAPICFLCLHEEDDANSAIEHLLVLQSTTLGTIESEGQYHQ